MHIRDIPITLTIALAAVGGPLGCGGERHHLHNVGKACIYPATEPDGNPLWGATSARDYTADGALNVAVFLGCLSSSCTEEISASCTVQQTGSLVQVDAVGSYRDTGASACSTDCRPLLARCETAPAAPGTVTLQYAGGSADLLVPSSSPPPCIDAIP